MGTLHACLATQLKVLTNNGKGNLMKALLIALLGMSVIGLTACNTVEGFGQDVKATGKGIEKAADQSKPK